MGDHAIHCARDGAKAEIYTTEDESQEAKCPVCGRSDALDFARAEAAKADLASRIDHAIEECAVEEMTGPPSTVEPRWVFGEA